MHIKHLQGKNIHYILYTKVDKAFKPLITLLYYIEYCKIAYFVNSECSMAYFLTLFLFSSNFMFFCATLLKKHKTLSILIYSYIKTSGNWKNYFHTISFFQFPLVLIWQYINPENVLNFLIYAKVI